MSIFIFHVNFCEVKKKFVGTMILENTMGESLKKNVCIRDNTYTPCPKFGHFPVKLVLIFSREKIFL